MSAAYRRASIGSVAAAAGVSPATVSRVFRQSVHVEPVTRRQVQLAARRLGYRPNPLMGRLMHLVRAGKQRKLHSTIALIRNELPDVRFRGPECQFVSLADIRPHAERHGYRAEEFRLGVNGLTPERIRQVIRARGIEGVIVSPRTSESSLSFLDYAKLAAVAFTNAPGTPELHRVTADVIGGVATALRELQARGYRRVGLAITDWINWRSSHTYSAAMLDYQHQIRRADRVPLLLFDDDERASEVFCGWVRKHRPDVIISFERDVPEWVTRKLGLAIARDIGFVVHDWNGGMRNFAGIHHRRAEIAAAAVDLVVTQLLREERGVPAVPRKVLIKPEFVDGPSIRPRK